MGNWPVRGTITETDFARDSNFGFFVGNNFVESSPHRFCFTVSGVEHRLTPLCSVCQKWKNCNLAWKELTL